MSQTSCLEDTRSLIFCYTTYNLFVHFNMLKCTREEFFSFAYVSHQTCKTKTAQKQLVRIAICSPSLSVSLALLSVPNALSMHFLRKQVRPKTIWKAQHARGKEGGREEKRRVRTNQGCSFFYFCILFCL